MTYYTIPQAARLLDVSSNFLRSKIKQLKLKLPKKPFVMHTVEKPRERYCFVLDDYQLQDFKRLALIAKGLIDAENNP